ncbi:MAG: cyclophilin-like fold protein [bacterium]
MAERRIKITAGSVTAEAVLNDSQTSEKIWNALPIEASGNTWGDEIYFSIPVKDALAADAKEVVALGDLAYWPPGSAFCIFFGRTPASEGDEIRPASAVNPVGKVVGDAKIFKSARSGEKVILERL